MSSWPDSRVMLGSRYRLEPMVWRHLMEVVHIETSSYSNPWPRRAFEHEIANNPFSRPQVAVTMTAPSRVVGYCVLWLAYKRMHVQNIAVHPAFRGRGLGRDLLTECLEQGRRGGAITTELEVRASNVSAQSLYLSAGFQVAGYRRGYYTSPREDAVLMETKLV